MFDGAAGPSRRATTGRRTCPYERDETFFLGDIFSVLGKRSVEVFTRFSFL